MMLIVEIDRENMLIGLKKILNTICRQSEKNILYVVVKDLENYDGGADSLGIYTSRQKAQLAIDRYRPHPSEEFKINVIKFDPQGNKELWVAFTCSCDEGQSFFEVDSIYFDIVSCRHRVLEISKRYENEETRAALRGYKIDVLKTYVNGKLVCIDL